MSQETKGLVDNDTEMWKLVMYNTEWMEEQLNDKEKWRAREYIALLSISYSIHCSTKNTAVGVVTCYGLVGRGIGVCFSAGERHFFLLQRVMAVFGSTQSHG